MTRAPGARPRRASGRLGLALASALCAVGVGASCRNAEKSRPPAATASVRTPAPSGSATTPSLAETSPPAAVPRLESARCRALRVSGDVKFTSGEALAPMSPVDGERWVRLGRAAELVLRHSVSARELSLRGPGEMLPCRGGEEQVLIESGTLKTAPGTGVRPGAEVWIGTPFGTARYGDAAAEVTVAKARWRIAVQSGTVWTDPPLAPESRAPNSQLASSPAGERDGRLGGNERATWAATPKPDALLLACQSLAEKTKAAAEGVASGGPGLGERAAAQLLLRRRARSACLAAAAAAPRVASRGARARLEDQVRAADRLWEHVPAPSEARGAGGSGQP